MGTAQADTGAAQRTWARARARMPTWPIAWRIPTLDQPQPRDPSISDQLHRLQAALSDRYRVERELGSGGMATVYLAQDVRHDRKVAIKVLRPDLAATLGPERFHREIKIAAQLQHPHILPLLDSGSVEESEAAAGDRTTRFLYYVMPYVEGQSLRDKLTKEGELPVGEAVRILRDVVDALTEAHAHGVIHRDIKPENVLLRGRHALVMDFGVAKAVSEATGKQQLTTVGVTLGTPAYMAPEQAAADPQLDQRVDIYAVGALGYELLTGRPVFMGTTPQMVLAAHVTETPVPLSQRRQSVPPAFEALLMKCLAKSPADRWQTAEELLPHVEALTTPSGGVTPAATVAHVGTVASTAPHRRRSGIRIAAVTVVALVVLAAGAAIGRLLLPEPGLTLDRHRVAFVPLENRTGDTSLDYVGRMVAEALGNSVTREQIADVVPVASVVAVQNEDATGADDRDMQVARATGAGIVIGGAVYPDGARLRLQLTATDAALQVPFAAIEPVTAARDSIPQATDALRGQVGVLLIMMFDDEVGASAATLGYPALDAYRSFQDGKDRFWELDLGMALGSLLQAARLDSVVAPMALIWAQLAAVNAGQPALGDSLLAAMVGMRERLPEYHRAIIDVAAALDDGDRERAYRAGALSVRLLPSNPAARILHAYLCIGTNRPREALTVLDGIDSVVGDSRARMWWVMRRRREAQYRLDAFDDALRAARTLRELHSAPGRVAQDWQDELVILAVANRQSELDQDVASFSTLAPPELAVGRSLANVALALRLRGDEAAAEGMLRRATAWWESQSANARSDAEWRLAYVETLYAAQRWDDAQSELERLTGRQAEVTAAAAREVNVIGYLGLVAARSGDRARADSLSQAIAAVDDEGLSLSYRARIAAVLGDQAAAVQLLRRAIDRGYPFFGQPFEQFPLWDFASLSDYEPYLSLVAPRG